MLPEVNLLPKYERAETRLYNLFLIGLILLSITMGVFIYFYFSTSSALEDADIRVAALEEEKLQLEASLQSNHLESVEPSIREAVTYVESYQLPTSKLVDELMELLPDQAYLSSYNFNYNSVTIQTQFESLPASSTYVADLTNSPYLNHVIVNQIGTFTNENTTMEDEQGEFDSRYDVIPRYDVGYSMEVDHQSLKRGEESDEAAISGE